MLGVSTFIKAASGVTVGMSATQSNSNGRARELQMVFEKCTNANATALSRVLFQGNGSLSYAVNTPIQIGGRYKAISTFSPVLKWFEDACVRVLVYSTGTVRNELICGYANVVHISS